MTTDRTPRGLAALVQEVARIAATVIAGDESRSTARPPTIVGIGWATVELDRAARELAAAVAEGASAAFRAGGPDPFLGAASRMARSADGRWVVLLEPMTEGRLAAYLARYGEGVAVAYASGSPEATTPASHAEHVGRPARIVDGPLGRQQTVGGPPDGPWLILVEGA